MWLGSVSRGGVELLAFAPDSRTLYTRSAADLTAWDVGTQKPTKIGLASWYASNGALALAPDGHHLVVTHANCLDIYDVPERRATESREYNLREIWAPTFTNGGELLTIDYMHTAEHVLMRRTWPSLEPLPMPPDVPVGEWFELGTNSPGDRFVGIVQNGGRNDVAVFAAGFPTSAAAVQLIAPDTNFAWHPVLSPDAGSVAIVYGGRVAGFDVASGASRFDVRISRSDVNRIAMHPSGRLLAAGGNDGTVRFLDSNSGGVLKAFDWGIGKIRSLAFSADGCLCAAGGQKSLAVWDVDD